MALTARIEIRLSPQEKEVIELKAKSLGLTVSDYVRACCQQDVLSEVPPAAIKKLFQDSGQQTIDMLAGLRAATLRKEAKDAHWAEVLRQAGLRRIRRG